MMTRTVIVPVFPSVVFNKSEKVSSLIRIPKIAEVDKTGMKNDHNFLSVYL